METKQDINFRLDSEFDEYMCGEARNATPDCQQPEERAATMPNNCPCAYVEFYGNDCVDKK